MEFLLSVGIVRDTVFTFLALWGLYSFYPNKSMRENTAAGWLVLAIWVGFLGAGLNVFYWKILSEALVYFEIASVFEIRRWGNTYGDFLWKGAGIVSIYLHFYARYKAIPTDEQRFWSPLLMGFYPNTKALAVQTLNRWRHGKDIG